MIRYFVTLITAFFISNIHCWGQKTLNIEDFAEEHSSKFGDASEVTRDELKKDFILQITDKTKVDKALIKGQGDFIEWPLDETQPEGKIRYKVTDPKVSDDGFLEIKLLKGEAEKIVKIKVTGKAPGSTDVCEMAISESQAACPKNDFDNKFGLVETDFDKSDVIYVYDFNKITSKRRFYKASYEREKFLGTKTFNIRKVNLSKETLLSGKQVWVKLVNVNRFVYDASIEDTLVDYGSEPSALFNRMFIGDTSSLLGTLMTNFSGGIKSQSFSADTKKDIENMVEAISCFNTMYTSLQAEMIKAYDPCQTFNCCNNIDFKKIISKLNNINSGIALLQLKSADKKKNLADLKKKKEDCTKKDDDTKKINDRIAELKKIEKPTEDQMKEIKAKEEELKKIVVCTKEEKEKNDKDIADLETELSTITGLADIQSHLPKAEEIRVLSVFLLNMVEQNQNLMKGPIQLKGNRLDFTLHLTSIDSITKRFGYPSFKDSLHYEIPILLKPFVSFSSGSFLALGKNLQNKLYSWQPATGNNNTIDTAKYTLVENAYTLQPAGFAAFGNFEWKIGRSIGFGASVGIGLTIESSPRLTYLSGGSLFLGDLRQFAITCGFAGMNVNRLTNSLLNSSVNQTIYTSKPNIEYYKEFKIGGFISLTYTPFKSIKSK